MKRILFILLIFPISIFSESPIEFQVYKSTDTLYKLKISLKKGYAIQKDAPHKIKLLAESPLKILNYDTKLDGPIILDKPEYYEYVNELNLSVKGKGEFTIDARIFYCDLNKGLCYPGKIKKKDKIL
jgi:hypothetical protein